MKFSDRPPVRAGSDAIWDQAEGALQSASKAAGLDLILNPGEGAFYGPKLEFVLRDAIGRDWQCGTLQVDFVLPERLGAQLRRRGRQRASVPVMLHRAIFGSFERFIGILIEHYAGRFPLWLAPTQAVVATIVNDADAYANEVADKLRAAGMRVETRPAQREDQLQGPRAFAGPRAADPRRRPARHGRHARSPSAAWARKSRRSLNSGPPSLNFQRRPGRPSRAVAVSIPAPDKWGL